MRTTYIYLGDIPSARYWENVVNTHEIVARRRGFGDREVQLDPRVSPT